MAEALVLHAVRVRGAATTEHVAARTGLDVTAAQETLLDCEASGLVSRYSYFGEAGWTITDAGRRVGEALVAEELDAAGARASVTRAYRSFVLLNEQFLTAITAWQLEGQSDALLDDLRAIVRSVHPLLTALTDELPRFGSYRPRFDLAVSMALVGRAEWVDGLAVDSLHRVWFELHEDLLATLGLRR